MRGNPLDEDFLSESHSRTQICIVATPIDHDICEIFTDKPKQGRDDNLSTDLLNEQSCMGMNKPVIYNCTVASPKRERIVAQGEPLP